VLLILVDGLGPDYVAQSDMPNLRRLAAEGFYAMGKGILPSVTNVNNASVVTASFPEEHGVEEICGTTEAAAAFHLRAERIGDLFLLAARDTAFGSLPTARQQRRDLPPMRLHWIFPLSLR
jgi:phosphonoacetate hydrolase